MYENIQDSDKVIRGRHLASAECLLAALGVHFRWNCPQDGENTGHRDTARYSNRHSSRSSSDQTKLGCSWCPSLVIGIFFSIIIKQKEVLGGFKIKWATNDHGASTDLKLV